ncbi:MAG: MgtC/SapB family protein [Betaproteobacteria bacterium]
MDWLRTAVVDEALRMATALAIGLLMGMERERNPSAKAGLRTFALIALFGVTLALLGEKSGAQWLPAVGLVLVGALLIGAQFRDDNGQSDPGATTIVAGLVCFTLATLVWYGLATLAVMAAIAATVLLAFKTELRTLTLGLERQELISILQFAVLTFVVLPVLPDRPLGPYDALNLRQAWLMVVLVSGVSLAGYVAFRIAGQHLGVRLAGLFGGLVSSTATTLVYARHGKRDAALEPLAATVIVIANLVVLVRLAVVTAVVAPSLAPTVLPVLGCGALAGIAGALPSWRATARGTAAPALPLGNPTELRASLTFGALYAVVLLLAAWLNHVAGQAGLYAVALASGATDVDAITLSAMRLHHLGQLEPGAVATVVALALLANLAFKLGVVFTAGGPALGRRCTLPLAAVAAGIAAGAWLLA